jgi:hypothetical protein
MIASARLEFNALQKNFCQVKAGEEAYDHLPVVNIPGKEGVKKRTVELFASDPTVVYGPQGVGGRNIVILEERRGKPFDIPICIKARNNGTEKVRVAVVDLATRETIEQFLVVLEVDKPSIEHAHKIKVIAG